MESVGLEITIVTSVVIIATIGYSWWKCQQEKTASENRLKVSEEKVKKLKKEKENALQRLSEIASSKLKFNNPGIVDLSDENRPNKLAEMASELYDNEWTSAFERLSTDTVPKSEGEIIAKLLGLLQATYNYCQNIAGSQRKALLDALFGPLQRSNQSTHSDCSIHVQKKLSDAQKDVATYLLKEVQQGFKSIESAEKFGDLMDNCTPYFEKCMRLCWLMSVNDPPVIFDFGDINFDKSRFREFTKSGKEVDFIVWPAMLIVKDGPLLQKGVWQPK